MWEKEEIIDSFQRREKGMEFKAQVECCILI